MAQQLADASGVQMPAYHPPTSPDAQATQLQTPAEHEILARPQIWKAADRLEGLTLAEHGGRWDHPASRLTDARLGILELQQMPDGAYGPPVRWHDRRAVAGQR
jgi:hypothetical protein